MKDVMIKNLKKTFYSLRRGKIEALKGIDLEIEAGKFFVLLGPSGCGKSTLLNIIAGIEKQSEGEIYFGDELVSSTQKKKHLSPKERDVAMVFQSYALYPHMTVYDNIAFPLKIAKEDKNEIDKKVKDAAKKLEIINMLDAKPNELSGGQRQRVALGRAIVRKPNVLLLDEPLSNLDAMLRITMRSELKMIQKEFNLTTIYVTHDQVEAMSLGDSIAVLKEGNVEQVGKGENIYNEPANLFVAEFMGTPPMNVLDEKVIKHLKNKIDLETLKQDKEIILGLRPEHIKVVEKEKGKLEAKLNMIGSIGSEAILYLEIENKEILAKVNEKPSAEEGQTVGIDFNENELLVFDETTKERI